VSTIEPLPPQWMSDEEWLKFRADSPTGQGSDVVVVSGYAGYDYASQDTGRMQGGENSDFEMLNYDVRLFVGPRWRQVNDVSPIAFIAGYSHASSDEADATGMRLSTCTWAWIEGPENPTQQIQLQMLVEVMGGPDAEVRAIGYHFTARGWLLPNQDFKEVT
jgi:hypothetical protein